MAINYAVTYMYLGHPAISGSLVEVVTSTSLVSLFVPFLLALILWVSRYSIVRGFCGL